MSDRRSDPRVALVCEVVYEFDGARLNGRAMDVSAGGMYIDTRQCPSVGSQVTVEFDLDSQQVRLKGEVVFSQPPIGFGVRFYLTNPDDRELLRRYIAGHAPAGVT